MLPGIFAGEPQFSAEVFETQKWADRVVIGLQVCLFAQQLEDCGFHILSAGPTAAGRDVTAAAEALKQIDPDAPFCPIIIVLPQLIRSIGNCSSTTSNSFEGSTKPTVNVTQSMR